MRRCLAYATRDTGIKRTALHSTAEGYPAYLKMGYRPTGESALYVPAQGALQLLHQDPKTQGPQLFATHCSSCHRYDGHDGLGAIPADAPSAPDLKGFASRQWLTEFLNPDHIATERYFGGTAFEDGDMVKYVTDDVAEFDADKKDALAAVVRILSAEAQLPSQKNPETTETPLSDEDRDELFYDVGCTECHEFQCF